MKFLGKANLLKGNFQKKGMDKQIKAGEWDQGLIVIRYEGMFQGVESVIKLCCGDGCTILILMKSIYVYNPIGKFHGKTV